MKTALSIDTGIFDPDRISFEDNRLRMEAIQRLGETFNTWWGKTFHQSIDFVRTPGACLASWLLADEVELRTQALHQLLMAQDGIFITWGALFNLARNSEREDLQARLLELLGNISHGYEPEGAPFAIRPMSDRTLLGHLPVWCEVLKFDKEMQQAEWTHFADWRTWMSSVWKTTPEQHRKATAKRTA